MQVKCRISLSKETVVIPIGCRLFTSEGIAESIEEQLNSLSSSAR